jgi:glyoxylase I family protein
VQAFDRGDMLIGMSKTNNVLGGGGFHHVAINARDFDRSVKFYCDTLGFRPKVSWGDPGKRAIMLDSGDGNYLEIFEATNVGPIVEGGAILHMCFRTSDTRGMTERIRAAGMKITMEPKDIAIKTTDHGPGEVPITISFFQGPDGEIVELFQNSYT